MILFDFDSFCFSQEINPVPLLSYLFLIFFIFSCGTPPLSSPFSPFSPFFFLLSSATVLDQISSRPLSIVFPSWRVPQLQISWFLLQTIWAPLQAFRFWLQEEDVSRFWWPPLCPNREKSQNERHGRWNKPCSTILLNFRRPIGEDPKSTIDKYLSRNPYCSALTVIYNWYFECRLIFI